MRNVKVELEDTRLAITKNGESITIDEESNGTYHLWITRHDGAMSVAVFRFIEDMVDIVSNYASIPSRILGGKDGKDNKYNWW